jgi:hypothetical protein
LLKQKRKARTGFNPKTQQKIRIPARAIVKFRVAKVVKDAVLGVKRCFRIRRLAKGRANSLKTGWKTGNDG